MQGQTLLLHGQQVHGDDDAHQEVGGEGHKTPDACPDAAGDGGEHLLGAGQYLLRQHLHEVVVVALQILLHPAGDLRVLLQQIGDPDIYLIIVAFGVVDKHGHAVDELGDQHAHQQIQQVRHHGPRQQDTDTPQQTAPELGLLTLAQPLQPLTDQALDPVDDGCQQIGHGEAVQHRGQHRHQLAQIALEGAVHIECIVKGKDGADGEKHRQAPFEIVAFLLLHGWTPSAEVGTHNIP